MCGLDGSLDKQQRKPKSKLLPNVFLGTVAAAKLVAPLMPGESVMGVQNALRQLQTKVTIEGPAKAGTNIENKPPKKDKASETS